MWHMEKNSNSIGIFSSNTIRAVILPMILPCITPITSIVLSRAVTSPLYNGGFIDNLIDLFYEFRDQGIIPVILQDSMNPVAWKIIFVFMITQYTLMKVLPGEIYKGPVSPMNNRPEYKDNSFACFVVSLMLFASGVYSGMFNGGILFDYFRELISSMNVFAVCFCLMLYAKGHLAPSSTDSGSTGNPFWDYYWGMELYPRVFGVDVKVFTNCRFGMTGWTLLVISYACAQYERSQTGLCNAMALSVALQVIYLAKFHYWERGYMYTIDIMHDRAGYYICWGCMVWVPSLYTIPTGFLVLHPYNFPTYVAVTFFVLGLLSIYFNYDVDRQRQQFRRQHGNIQIGGKPATYIVAEYRTTDNKTHSSLLLTSGWWGVCRKINYFFELSAAFIWSCIVAHPFSMVPYFYFGFVLILLLDRAWRDDGRCREKYGTKWDQYCKQVPYMLIPGIY